MWIRMILFNCRITVSLRKISHSIYPSSGANWGRSQYFAIPAVLCASLRPCDICGHVFPGCMVWTYAVLSEVNTLLSKYHRELFLPCASGFPFGHEQVTLLTHLSSFLQPRRLRVTGWEPIPAPPPCLGHSLFLRYMLPSLQTYNNWSWPKLPSVALRFCPRPELADLIATTRSGHRTREPWARHLRNWISNFPSSSFTLKLQNWYFTQLLKHPGYMNLPFQLWTQGNLNVDPIFVRKI